MKPFLIFLLVLGQEIPKNSTTNAAGDGAQPTKIGLHAHNDYYHKRPLHEALENGFDSVEADVFLSKGDLLVGHFTFELKPERSLKALYLEPLAKLHQTKSLKPMWLLVDIKSNEAEATAKLLQKQLDEYPGLFCRWEKGVADAAPIKVVLSGTMPKAWVESQTSRSMTLDGREADLAIPGKTSLIPWVSEPWSKHFAYKGVGEMPEDQKQKLVTMVKKAESAGQQLRFWGAPDNPGIWKAQLDCGVQRIGTDKLAQIKEFTDKQRGK